MRTLLTKTQQLVTILTELLLRNLARINFVSKNLLNPFIPIRNKCRDIIPIGLFCPKRKRRDIPIRAGYAAHIQSGTTACCS
jgi:hypothetical protein